MERWEIEPPYKVAGAVMLVCATTALAFIWAQFRGDLLARVPLTVMTARSGLSVNPGAKVTLNGVQIGRVDMIEEVDGEGSAKARLTLEVDPKYLGYLPRNVAVNINASTVFGDKTVAFTLPTAPVASRLTSHDVVDATAVTTEFNSLFETLTAIHEQVDPIKLNQTLSAAAQALDGTGDEFGQSFLDGVDILADVNSRMPQIRRAMRGWADASDVYAGAAPHALSGLDAAVITTRTLNEHQSAVDQALIAALGFGDTGSPILEEGGPFLVQGSSDLIATSQLLDVHSPALYCAIRKYHDAAPAVAEMVGGNGYSTETLTEVTGLANPYVYPDNLPRVNAKGGPEGRPGCWQEINRDMWPMPYLVMDTGASIAPYNHLEFGHPFLAEYVWGRQVGENTINP
ncbi:MCE family protein [Mycobacterium sp. 134]|uniref:MCE family protein n=1 Tax=Mycobacterium sp. 134 TaxID=3400425 RepID=UPI003AAC54F1